eukprot:366175-Chlamydomonas_euryale.AAC.2
MDECMRTVSCRSISKEGLAWTGIFSSSADRKPISVTFLTAHPAHAGGTLAHHTAPAAIVCDCGFERTRGKCEGLLPHLRE